MEWLKFGVYAAIVIFIAGFIVGISLLLGPRRYSKVKSMPYECGKDPIGDTRQRFSIKFYMIAILFIVFDIETVFLIPWAVIFESLSWAGFAEMAFFIAILGFGLLYLWKKGALEWE